MVQFCNNLQVGTVPLTLVCVAAQAHEGDNATEGRKSDAPFVLRLLTGY